MPITRRQIRALRVLQSLMVLLAVALGAGTGLFLSGTRNLQAQLDVGEYNPTLPSLLLDRRGKLITQYFAEEKRTIVALDEISPYLIYALIAKEDRTFYRHFGFSIKGFLRAAWNILSGRYFSGGSTISQQVAGNLYEDREIYTIGRKLKELYWSVQLEKRRTKNEILEIYLNNSNFGHGTYGVEAAAHFYFGHSSGDLTIAESAMLVTQLARINSMIRNPNRARIVQKLTLDAMVSLGFVSQGEADRSFAQFWTSFDTTRSNVSTAYTEKADEAPYFSEFVRKQFETTFYGSSDLHRDGYTIHTTLDLEYQRAAEQSIEKARDLINARYIASKNTAIKVAESELLPLIGLVSFAFSSGELLFDRRQKQKEAVDIFRTSLSSALESAALVFDIVLVQYAMDRLRDVERIADELEQVEGALVTVDNESGFILAMVGGGDFAVRQFNLAVDGRMSPGSSIKPLYYVDALEGGEITPATMFYDSPSVFFSELNPPYAPRNFLGIWRGPVLVRDALSNSMNVASIKVLETIGLERGISRIASMLGEEEESGDRLRFPRVFPMGLGTLGVSPLQMAAAYSIFANGGRRVAPFAIRFIEDRYGNVIYNNESVSRTVMSPQVAYLMTDILQTTLESGTLARRVAEARGVGNMPMAGKTGTTENWADAWTVGFSPFYSSAIWLGFVRPGNSLGRFQTGASVAGPAWVEYMKVIHEDLPRREFQKPEAGIISRQVCSVSGLLFTENCTEGVIEEIFISGTEPDLLCGYHEAKNFRDRRLLANLVERMQLMKPDVVQAFPPDLMDLDSSAKQEALRQSAPDVGENPLLF